ncbi:NAD nucleotidase [Neiella marina]|uniref:NAD nucleotidase n=1 Tax=Neiella holothuriorum TaxID=2870530 RepID=A0ABS7EGJ6_9GAMM|nr:NAD nucleotidase [Neiella holothuriorum]MBW8191463.1 NAD nucleotidase [Neiella holothuriorum]
MKTFSKLLLAGLVSAALMGCNDDNDKAINVTLLHINDHHSHISSDDFDYDVSSLGLSATTEAGDPVTEVAVNYGGFAMMKTLFDDLAAAAENPIKIHAGDAITGTLYYTLFAGEADADVMNDICFDAFALGNHEFDDGDAGLATFLDYLAEGSCQTPVLAANVVPHEDSAIADGYIQPYTVLQFEGEKVGLIGIDIADKTKNSSQPDDGTEFLDEIETAQSYIDELKLDGVNKIILVTHYQYANDLSMAQALAGVDVIVGGDSHTLLGSDALADVGFNVQGDYPTITTNADGEPVCVVQAWEYAHLMGQLQVSFDKKGVVESCAGTPVMPIEQSFSYEYNEDDSAVLDAADEALVVAALEAVPEMRMVVANENTAAMIAAFDEQKESLEQSVIGQVAEDLCLERFPGQGRSTICDASETYAMGSDISNIVAKAFLMVTPTADIAIQNGGGVRVDVAAGDYTIADAYTLLPFSNTLVTLDMTGQQIITVLEDALSNTLDDAGSSGSYPYASGLRYDVDASAAEGSRISNVEVNSRVAGDWAAIDTSATYTVVTNDFIASGRDGYDTFGVVYDAGDFVDTYTEYAQGFVSYVEMLTEANESLMALPTDEYSTQRYIGSDGCDHSSQSDCAGY